jgi:hypothetical protein
MLYKGKGTQHQLCFDFTYLSVITDDKWLSFPKEIFNELYDTRSSFSHLCKTDSSYAPESLKVIKNKAREVLYFLRVLEASFNIEIKEMQGDLYQSIINKDIAPNFDQIKKNIINAVGGILSIFSGNLAEGEIKYLKNLSEKLNNNEEFDFDGFFRNYYSSGDKISL